MFEVTETRTTMFTADEIRRTTALGMAIEVADQWPVSQIMSVAKLFERYMRGDEEEQDPTDA